MLCRYLRRFTRKNRAHTEALGQQHDRSLAEAEKQLLELTARGDLAVRVLDERNHRNHWQEAVQQVIKGAF